MEKMGQNQPSKNSLHFQPPEVGVLAPHVIYEDENFLAVNKPSGLITHPKNEDDHSQSVAGWILDNHPSIRGVGEYADRPGIMHRLDKETSGILIIAKDQTTYNYFKNLFQTRSIKKTYIALVIGHPKQERGIIDAPMGRIGMKRTTLPRHGKLKDEKSAITEYTVTKKFTNYSLLELSPKTGRTHQLRVHLKHIGCPIAGDVLYAPKDARRPVGLDHLFLHAKSISFTAPNGQAMTLEAELPGDLQKVINTLE